MNPSNLIGDDSGANFTEKLKKLRSAIFLRRPVLQDILERRGCKSLYDYGQDYLDVNINPTISGRQNEFLKTFGEEVERLLGKTVAESAVNQLRKYYFVSTADHHGPITSPFFLNSNLIIASSCSGNNDPLLKNIICLSCANISLNNSSFPRGLLFQAYQQEKLKVNRLSFLPSNAHSATVYNFRSFNEVDIKKVKQSIKDFKKTNNLADSIEEKLQQLIDDIYALPEVLNLKNYSEQVSITNYKLWNKFFHKDSNYLNLIYLEQESLVSKLLVENHLDRDTVISRILFKSEVLDLLEKYFEGIMGAFSRVDKWGTYFFWGVTADKNYRLSLWRKGQQLISEDGSFVLDLTPEVVKKALIEKRIIPSMMTNFLVLSFYYGIKCLGGFNQVNYLTQMKQAYIDLQKEIGDEFSANVCEEVQTKEFVDGPTISFLQGKKGELVPATGLDLFLYGNEHVWESLIARSKDITLGEAFDPLLPELYSIIYSEKEREKELAEITSEQITKHTCLQEKIRPCVAI